MAALSGAELPDDDIAAGESSRLELACELRDEIPSPRRGRLRDRPGQGVFDGQCSLQIA